MRTHSNSVFKRLFTNKDLFSSEPVEAAFKILNELGVSSEPNADKLTLKQCVINGVPFSAWQVTSVEFKAIIEALKGAQYAPNWHELDIALGFDTDEHMLTVHKKGDSSGVAGVKLPFREFLSITEKGFELQRFTDIGAEFTKDNLTCVCRYNKNADITGESEQAQKKNEFSPGFSKTLQKHFQILHALGVLGFELSEVEDDPYAKYSIQITNPNSDDNLKILLHQDNLDFISSLLKSDYTEEALNHYVKELRKTHIDSYKESRYNQAKSIWAATALLPVVGALPGALTLIIPSVGMVATVSLIAIGVLAGLSALVVRGLQKNERMRKIDTDTKNDNGEDAANPIHERMEQSKQERRQEVEQAILAKGGSNTSSLEYKITTNEALKNCSHKHRQILEACFAKGRGLDCTKHADFLNAFPIQKIQIDTNATVQSYKQFVLELGFRVDPDRVASIEWPLTDSNSKSKHYEFSSEDMHELLQDDTCRRAIAEHFKLPESVKYEDLLSMLNFKKAESGYKKQREHYKLKDKDQFLRKYPLYESISHELYDAIDKSKAPLTMVSSSLKEAEKLFHKAQCNANTTPKPTVSP